MKRRNLDSWPYAQQSGNVSRRRITALPKANTLLLDEGVLSVVCGFLERSETSYFLQTCSSLYLFRPQLLLTKYPLSFSGLMRLNSTMLSLVRIIGEDYEGPRLDWDDPWSTWCRSIYCPYRVDCVFGTSQYSSLFHQLPTHWQVAAEKLRPTLCAAFNEFPVEMQDSVAQYLFEGDDYSDDELQEAVFRFALLSKLAHELLSNLPNSLVSLRMHEMILCDSLISPPHSLRHISLTGHYALKLNDLPRNLETLEINGLFNDSVDNLPDSLIKLTLLGAFNQPITRYPPNLQRLMLGESFNQPLVNLPNLLTHLYIGQSFNQPLDSLPPYLKHLALGEEFNQPVSHLPRNLEYLSLGLSFNYPLTQLPSSLTHLLLSCDEFTHSLDYLPESLTHLWIQTVNIPINSLPNLTFLYIGSGFDQAIDNLPLSLTNLVFESDVFTGSLLFLPDKLRSLEISINHDFIPEPYNSLMTRRLDEKEILFVPSALTRLVVNDATIPQAHYQ